MKREGGRRQCPLDVSLFPQSSRFGKYGRPFSSCWVAAGCVGMRTRPRRRVATRCCDKTSGVKNLAHKHPNHADMPTLCASPNLTTDNQHIDHSLFPLLCLSLSLSWSTSHSYTSMHIHFQCLSNCTKKNVHGSCYIDPHSPPWSNDHKEGVF